MTKRIEESYLKIPLGMVDDRLGVYILKRTLGRKRFKTRINPREAAKELGVSTSTVRRWIRKGSPGKTWVRKKERGENLFLMNLFIIREGKVRRREK